MTGRQWIVLIAAVVLVVVLYNLPRSVVDNDAATAEVGDQKSEMANHAFDLPSDVLATLDSLRNSIRNEGLNEKSSIFADSLIGIFLSFNMLDSAEKYVDQIFGKDSSVSGRRKAGNLYFQLFGVTPNIEKAKGFAEKAAACFETVLQQQSDPDIQAKLAMTKVSTENPMQGVMMLRKVLEEYPDNTTVIYSLGVLSIQSGQYDKAVERFEKLMTIDPAHEQGGYYLAVSYFETDQLDDARHWFDKIKQQSTDPAIVNSANEYLKELNEL